MEKKTSSGQSSIYKRQWKRRRQSSIIDRQNVNPQSLVISSKRRRGYSSQERFDKIGTLYVMILYGTSMVRVNVRYDDTLETLATNRAVSITIRYVRSNNSTIHKTAIQ